MHGVLWRALDHPPHLVRSQRHGLRGWPHLEVRIVPNPVILDRNPCHPGHVRETMTETYNVVTIFETHLPLLSEVCVGLVAPIQYFISDHFVHRLFLAGKHMREELDPVAV